MINCMLNPKKPVRILNSNAKSGRYCIIRTKTKGKILTPTTLLIAPISVRELSSFLRELKVPVTIIPSKVKYTKMKGSRIKNIQNL